MQWLVCPPTPQGDISHSFPAHSYLELQVSKTSWGEGSQGEDQGCISTPCPDPSISVPAARPGATTTPAAACMHPLHPTQIRYVCHPGPDDTLLPKLFPNTGCPQGTWLLSGPPQLLGFFLAPGVSR